MDGIITNQNASIFINMNSETKALEKKLKIGTWIITVVVLFLVGLMRRVKIPLPEGMSFDWLPPVYSTINALCAVALLLSLYFIKQRNVEAHRKMNFAALLLSVIFLLGYVVYHFTMPETIFGDSNHNGVLEATEQAAVAGIRPWYLVLLISHIVLAAVILPFILYTFIKALTEQFDAHKKLARWVWPLWFYVALTGPICYLMLRPYYG